MLAGFNVLLIVIKLTELMKLKMLTEFCTVLSTLLPYQLFQL